MLNEQMYEFGSKSSVIRELFAYGLERKKIVGEDKVYDFSIGGQFLYDRGCRGILEY